MDGWMDGWMGFDFDFGITDVVVVVVVVFVVYVERIPRCFRKWYASLIDRSNVFFYTNAT